MFFKDTWKTVIHNVLLLAVGGSFGFGASEFLLVQTVRERVSNNASEIEHLRERMTGHEKHVDLDFDVERKRVEDRISQLRLDLDTERKRTDERVGFLVQIVTKSSEATEKIIEQNSRLIALIEAKGITKP